MLHELIKLCAGGGFHLTKFVSNKVEVLKSIAEADRRYGLKNIDINNVSDLPTERALGINCNIENDKLGFKVNLGYKPYTRRGMLSLISKIYDPLGLSTKLSPFLLKDKRFSRSYARATLAGMSKYQQRTTEEWEQWRNDLKLIENIKLDRSFKQPRFGRLIDCSLHTSQMQVKTVMVKYHILDWWMKTVICTVVLLWQNLESLHGNLLLSQDWN